MTSWLSLNNELKTKEALVKEYAQSIANPQWFAKATVTAFRKEHARLNKRIKEIKALMKKHPDNPKNFKG